MSKCCLCDEPAFGYGGAKKVPLCRAHYIKIIQLTCYYNDPECPYQATDEEWSVAKGITNPDVLKGHAERKEQILC